MTSFLYKVSPPAESMTFRPSRFWHTEDWESSTTRPRDGYIEDKVLYAGDFDEINIHLLPRVRAVRVRSDDTDEYVRNVLGLDNGKTAFLFVNADSKNMVENFMPTVYTFRNDGFERVRKGEYVSRKAQTAISSKTILMSEAIERWNIEVCYVEDLDVPINTLRRAGVYFDEQT